MTALRAFPLLAAAALLLVNSGCSAFGAFDNPHDALGTSYVPVTALHGAVYLAAGRDATTKNAFLAFQLPTGADLAAVNVTYQDVSSIPVGPATMVTLGVGAAPLGAYSPDPLANYPSANNRYFEPTVVAGDSYSFVITLVDAKGRLSGSQSASNSDSGAVTVTFAVGGYQGLVFSSGSPTVASGASLLIAPAAGTLAASGTNWNWYVNEVASGTGSSYTFSPTTPGYDVVEVTVSYQGTLYSGSVGITVTQ